MHLEGSNHPGFATIPTVVASCGLIWFATPQALVTRLLSSSLFVRIGKLSYSLYLWHFPIFAFGRLISVDTPTLWEKIFWLLATFAFSWLGHILVEQPFRYSITTRNLATFLIGGIAAIGAFSVVIIENDGLSGRFSGLAALYGPNEIDDEVLKKRAIAILGSLSANENLGPWNAGDPSKHEMDDLWFDDSAKRKVLIIGNSHSIDFFNAVYLNQRMFDGVEFARFALRQNFPEAQFQLMYSSPNFKAAETIVVSPKYNRLTMLSLEERVKEMIGLGKKVVLIGNAAEFDPPGTLPIFDWYIRRFNTSPKRLEINSIAYRFEGIRARSYNEEIRTIAKKYGIDYYDRRALMCDDSSKTCTLMTPEGWKAMRDNDHWTVEGAKYFGEKIAEEGWFK